MASRQIPFDLIVARTLSRGIGKNNQLPWKLPSDLRMFKKITTSGSQGNSIILGRKTFESVNRKILPNRLNIVLSKSTKIEESQNLRQASSLKEALDLAQSVYPNGRNFVIGGSQLFEEGLADCRYVY